MRIDAEPGSGRADRRAVFTAPARCICACEEAHRIERYEEIGARRVLQRQVAGEVVGGCGAIAPADDDEAAAIGLFKRWQGRTDVLGALQVVESQVEVTRPATSP